MGSSTDVASDLGRLRQLIFSIAYRMIGSVADAEDIVQESFLRLHRAQGQGTVVDSTKSYLAAIATRLSIDHLRSARVRREEYVGSWMPEPVIEGREPDIERRAENAESLSLAFMQVLETLSPAERAVFLLREVFDYEYADIAAIVDKSPDNCRQIFGRAKQRIEIGKPRFEGSREKRDELARQFLTACERGDVDRFAGLLAADVTFYGDGGGKAMAVLYPVRGHNRVTRLLRGIFTKYQQAGVRLQLVEVNSQPGAMVFDPAGRLINVFALEIVDGAVQAIRSVINPDKLRHLGPVSDLARLRHPH